MKATLFVPTLSLAVGGLLTGVASHSAQENSEGSLPLLFKHTAGTSQFYRAEMTGDLSLTPEGAGGAPGGLGPIPMSIKTNMAYEEKVTGTSKGTGTISSRINAMTSSFDVLGNTQVLTVKDGKARVLQNGQPVDAAAAGPQGAALASMARNLNSVIKRDPRGMITTVSGTGASLGQITGSPSPIIVQFPEKPVAVGESWEVVQTMKPSVPGGEAAGGLAIPAIEVRFTHTLKSVESKNGKKFALIDSTGSGETPADSKASVNQSINGTTRFDLSRGTVVSSQYTSELSLKVPLAGLNLGGQGGEGAPASIRIDGALKITVTETPAPKAPVKKAPAKKPARKR